MVSSLIKEKALELGFHLVGIAPASRFPEADAYRQWLHQGFAADMGYMARNVEKREDCRRLFPPARSVIVCGMSYHSSFSSASEPNDPLRGRISRYGWGNDYHIVVKNRLYALVEFIRHESAKPVEAKVCVDTVPILERLYGYYAGLGWIGKNSCLINHQYGSWFFLGEIVLNLDLEVDAPVPDRCGTCTRCLEACPTGALIAPRLLDARRCLSYLTIEFDSLIPEALRPAFGNTVFGCDRCQVVCPWNQKAKAPGCSSFFPKDHLYYPSFEWLLALSSNTFDKIFQKTPIHRTGYQRLLRNAVVAVGNSGRSDLIPVLHNLSSHTVPLVQDHIPWALECLAGVQSQTGTQSRPT